MQEESQNSIESGSTSQGDDTKPDIGEVAASRSVLTTRKFNNDLLIEEEDQELAKEIWGRIGEAFVAKPLIELFKLHEAKAKKYKTIVHITGTIAVVLMMVALISLALYLWIQPGGQKAPTLLPTLAVEITAFIGLIAAFLASRFGPFRGRWLRSRFLTEQFRRWHFRDLLNSVEKVAAPDLDISSHEDRRKTSFQSNCLPIAMESGDHMDRLVETGSDSVPSAVKPPDIANLSNLGTFFEAYYKLRLEHQINYAVHKLSERDRTFCRGSNRMLVWITDAFAGFSLFFAMLLSILQVIKPDDLRLAAAALALVVAGLGVRAWRDGFQLSQDRDRYRDYKYKLEHIRTRWKHAKDPNEQFQLAKEIEEVTGEELSGFLRSHRDAQFLF